MCRGDAGVVDSAAAVDGKDRYLVAVVLMLRRGDKTQTEYEQQYRQRSAVSECLLHLLGASSCKINGTRWTCF
jgi:hypothetical protein